MHHIIYAKELAPQFIPQNNMIYQHRTYIKAPINGFGIKLFSMEALADGDSASFLKFSTDFDAKCVLEAE